MTSSNHAPHSVAVAITLEPADHPYELTTYFVNTCSTAEGSEPTAFTLSVFSDIEVVVVQKELSAASAETDDSFELV